MHTHIFIYIHISKFIFRFSAVADVKDNGDGSTLASCMSCDPTKGECFFNCQTKIDAMYKFCAAGSLPDGYYYDPSKTVHISEVCIVYSFIYLH
jgi:hypothetical protein